MGNEALIDWKTRAWKDPAMVAWYSGRMVENSGTNRLKNRLEVDLCRRFAVGENVIDVGIGTGRGSLPLAREGFRVTGIDSSQAMLDECRRLAGEAPIELRLGDVARLPVEDGGYDTLVSLNVLVHFPHWREVLREWARVVREGGRIAFDVHSLDHLRLARNREVKEEELQGQDFSGYQTHVASADLVAEAQAIGLGVVAIVPYGAFLGGGNPNHLLAQPLERFHWWRRLLSWLASDDDLFALALFIEQEIVARLSPAGTGRYMAVFEKCGEATMAAAMNAAWLARESRLRQVLSEAADIGEVMSFLGIDAEDMRRRLSDLTMASPRGARFLGALFAAVKHAGLGLPLDGLLTEGALSVLEDFERRKRADAAALAMAEGWHDGFPEIHEATAYRGVQLAGVTEYFLVEQILTRAMNLFSGVRS